MSVLYHLLAGEAGGRREHRDPAPGPPGTPPTAPRSAATCSLRDGVVAEIGTVDAPTDVERVDADGLTLLPGFVDLHTHLREPGREDAETIASGSRAAAVGGYTAVLAMANTTPVTDTAEAAERILDLGRAAGLVDVVPVGAVTKGLEGAELAELGLMHRSRADVQVFSDDGHCVADARVMRRALEYVRAFGGVVSPAQPGPRPRRAAGLLPRGRALRPARAAGLARRSPRRASSPATRCSPSTPAAGCTWPTSARPRALEVVRWAKARGIAADGRGDPAPPRCWAPSCSPATTRSTRSTRRCARPRTSRRCATACSTAPSTPSPPTTHRTPGTTRSTPSSTRRSACSASRPPSPWCTTDGARRAARLGRPGRPMSVGPARIAGLADHGQPARGRRTGQPRARRPRRATVTVDRAASQSLSRNTPWHGQSFTGAVHTTILRGRVTAPREESADSHADHPRARRPRARGRPHLRRPRLRRTGARPSARPSSPPA